MATAQKQTGHAARQESIAEAQRQIEKTQPHDISGAVAISKRRKKTGGSRLITRRGMNPLVVVD